MIDWLKQKEKQQNNLFLELLNHSMATLKKVNEEGDTKFSLIINFTKEEWVDGKASVDVIQWKNDAQEEYKLKYTYEHSVHNKKEDIGRTFILKLMEEGMLTNRWFSILDASRIYDTNIILNNKDYSLENEDCEYLELRKREFNSLENIEPKNKSKAKSSPK